ncbi:hypothetical protein, conserved [Babesia ovata]|uniref:C3H1-type domain-containing protein n=1 Tax=Babesia ovata TaxID=189622 RepID=A0A2H6KJR7_9APIC|nr:uncharacterized protein BOVATA_047120 [Babesia ovata]GBE63219.1 hypothetical protein, conserved [Babesia ovata]
MKSLETLKELCQFANSLTQNQQNNPRDLLESLCSGLQTFLGYNEKSKGYTGSGIVYSDLDRLCDGVMAFLHSVLKDVHTKQPYSVGKNVLRDDVLSHLSSNLCSGHDGFKSVIGQVATGVGRYNEEVKVSNKKAKRRIERLLEKVGDSFRKQVSAIHDNLDPRFPGKAEEAVNSVRSTLEDCIKNGEALNETRDITTKDEIENAINDLNPTLRDKVNKARDSVRLATEHLTALSKDQSKVLSEMTTKIGSALSELRTNLDKEIDAKIPLLVSKLRERVRAIKKQLEEISGSLFGYVQDLERWIQKGNKTMEEALLKVNTISGKVDENSAFSNVTDIKQAADELKQDVNKLFEAKDGALEKVRNQVKEALKQVITMNSSLMMDLNDVKTGIKLGIKQYVETQLKQRDKLDKLEDKVKDGLEKVRDVTVKNAIEGFIRKLNEADFKGAAEAHGGHAVSIANLDKLQGTSLYTWLTEAGANSLRNVIHSSGRDTSDPIQYARKALLYSLENLRSAKHKNGGNDKSLFTAIGDDIVNKINKAIGEDRNSINLQTLMTEFNTADQKVKDLLQQGSGLQKKVDDLLTEQIGETDKGVAVTLPVGATQFQGYKEQVNQPAPKSTELEKLNGQLPKAIKKIQSEMDSVLDPLGAVNTDAEYKLQLLKQKLKTLCEDIKNAAGDPNGLKKILEVFKNKDLSNADHQLSGIRNKLSELQSKLESGPIRATENFIQTESNQLQNEYIQKLKEQVQHQVRNATDKLTTQAKKHHVITTKLLLKQFASRVTKELDGLPQQIEGDRHIGFKGFMEKFYGDYKRTLNPNNIDKLLNAKDKNNIRGLSAAFQSFWTQLKGYINDEIVRVHDENHLMKNPTLTKSTNYYVDKLKSVDKKFNTLLSHISGINRYDHHVSDYLKSLTEAIKELAPRGFANPNTPTLDAIGLGLSSLVGELRKAYISAYDSQNIDWGKDENSKENCAKVFLTSLPTLFNQLHYVFYNCCKKWKNCKIQSEGKADQLEKYLKRQGFNVDNLITKNNTNIDVSLRLSRGFGEYDEFTKDPDDNQTDFDLYLQSAINSVNSVNVLDNLFAYLRTYNEICHLATSPSPRSPCNVYEMLIWCSGLPYRSIYTNLLHDSIITLLSGPDSQIPEVEDDFEARVVDTKTLSLSAYPQSITYDDIRKAVAHMCSKSYDILITIVGTGDATTYYAYQYCDNTSNLHYPSNSAECFDMLFDMIRRLFPSLRFLYEQCSHSSYTLGWSQCAYGNYAHTSNWQCDQHDSQNPECQPKSPLMLFLTDGLPGHLPHLLESVGCKSKCSTCSPSSSKMPCITPLGFRAFSGSTRKGKDICYVLEGICGDGGVLTELYSAITCAVSRPPQTFADILSYYCQLTRPWKWMPTAASPSNSIQLAVCDEIMATVGCDYYDAKKFLEPCRQLHDSPDHVYHDLNKELDLSYLVGCGSTDCGYFIRPLSFLGYSTFAPTFAKNYLSWLLYVCTNVETFLEQLKRDFCNVSCYASGCAPCLNDDSCKPGKHGTTSCGCRSMVHCHGVSSVLYQYGFIFADTAVKSKKQCKHFYKALNSILNSKYLREFHGAIDTLMFTIRAPFIWTLVSLWSLSLLYLLHIAVVRLDVLRIRSHLKSPSSHRIAAQSLLTAARVKALANSLNEQIDLLKNSDKSTANSQNDSKIDDLKSKLKDHVAKYHSLSESDRTAQLKDVHSRMLSLADLSGKLGQFIGKSEVVTKAINDGITAIISSDKDFKSLKKSPSPTALSSAAVSAVSIDDAELTQKIEHFNKHKKSLESKKNSENPSLSSEDSRLLSSHQSKLDALQKLKSLNESLNSLGKQSDDACKNLLNNLCTGLEKFLGYENGNYTGEGIVYSDLDRLCDGVMAFLHSLLKDVKENNNLEPYKEKLTQAVSLLETHRYNGQTGLRAVIDTVKLGIERWLGDVNTKSEAVKKPLEELLKPEYLPKIITVIQDLKTREYNDVKNTTLLRWMDAVQKLPEYFFKSLRDIHYLDQNLQKDLSPHVSLIKDRVETFVESTKKDHEGLKEVCGKVDEKMSEIIKNSESVSGNAANKIDSLTTFLKGEINTLHEHIKKVVPGVKKAIEELEKWLKNDNGSNLHNALQKCDAVVKALDENANSDLKRQFTSIEEARSTVQSVHGELGGIDSSLSSWIQKAEQTMQNALLKAKQIFDKVQETSTLNITHAISDLKQKTQEHFFNLKQEELKGYASEATEHLNKMVDAVESLVDEKLADAFDKYKLWVENGVVTGSRGNQMTSQIRQLPNVIQSLKEMSNTVKQAAQSVEQNSAVRSTPFYPYTLPLSGPSPLQTSLTDLEQNVQAVQSIEAEVRSLQMQRTGQPTAANVSSSHLNTLSTLASTTRKVVNDIVAVLKDRIRSGVMSIGRLTISSDLSKSTITFHGSLQNAVGIAQSLYSQLQSINGRLPSRNGTVSNNLSVIQNVSQDLGGLVQNVQRLSTAFNDQKSLFSKFDNNVSTPFNKIVQDVRNAAGQDQTNGLQSTLQTFKETTIQGNDSTDKLGKIRTDIHSQMSQLFPKISAINSAVEAIKSQLSKISKMVKKGSEKETINGFLESLKGEISSLKQSLTDLKAGDLTSMIANVQHEFDEAKKFIVKYIQSTCNEAISNAKVAGKEIKRQALSQFAASKAHALEQLKELVEKETERINEIIYVDSVTGLKGFMKIFNDKCMPELVKIKDIQETPTSQKSDTTYKFPLKQAAYDLNKGFGDFLQEFEEQRKECAESYAELIQPDAVFPESSTYLPLTDAIGTVLDGLVDAQHFDHTFSTNLKSLNNALSTFTPAKFTDSSSPILQALKDGIGALAKQLGYAYASTYCCKKFDGALLDPEILDLTTPDDKRKLTDYGKKLSKVFMTCLPGWVTHMYNLQRNCSGEWSKLEINTPTEKNKMALWFHSRGYNVSDNDKIQNGHLRRDMKGGQINSDLLNKPLTNAAQMNIKIKGLKNTGINVLHILSLLYPILERYNRVCHYNIPPKPRAPSNIYLMLQWTAGLKYNHMYSEVKSQLGNVLKGLQKEHKLDTEALPVAVQTDMHNLITSPIDSAQLTKALDNVCIYSEKTLVAVLGHGHADGVYASDHLTNSSNLLYPGSGGACLDMLVDVLFRLYQQLWFLRKQCLGGKSHSGWSDCSYGRYVSGSSWLCNTEQCANQECNLRPNQGATQKGNQNGNLGADQSADQRCDQHPDCGMKSPLQSFLEDGLQGFLPHSFSSPGCKLTCTVSNHRGLPCKTPMGFADIGVVASHTKTGAYLERVLFDFCGPYSALTRLCNMLNCVLRRAPQTLDDIFGFLRGYLANWIDHGREHKCLAFSKAIKDAYFGQEYSDLTPTILFTTRVHQSGNKSNHSEGDLFTISECEDRAVDTCGVYLESLSSSTYSIFSSYNKKQYLSWFLYSAETFYSLLDKLYKQCCGTCTSPGAKCHGTRCDKDCDVKKAYEAQNSEDAEAASKSLDGKITLKIARP